MSIKRRVLLTCFIVLAVFSVSLLTYTLYITLGITRATRSITISLLHVETNENESKAYFPLTIYNPSNVQLELFFLRMNVYFNSTYLGKKESNFENNPISLSPNVEANLTVSLVLDNPASYSNGVWELDLTVILETPLPQTARISRSISLGENS